MKPEPLLDVREVAELLGVRQRWVYERAQAGDLPSFSVGRYRRFRASEIEAWLLKHRNGGTDKPTYGNPDGSATRRGDLQPQPKKRGVSHGKA